MPVKASTSIGFADEAGLSASVPVEERDRKVIDLAGFETAIPPLPEIGAFPGLPVPPGEHGVFFAPGSRLALDEEAIRAFEEAMRDLEGRFESEEWQEKLKRFREMDLGKIQDRMKEVEDRLRKLESELDQEGKKKLYPPSRELRRVRRGPSGGGGAASQLLL